MNSLTIATIAQLIAQYGVPLAQQIDTWVKDSKKTELTDADWALLNTLSSYRSSDSLAAAGIKIENGVVVKV